MTSLFGSHSARPYTGGWWASTPVTVSWVLGRTLAKNEARVAGLDASTSGGPTSTSSRAVPCDTCHNDMDRKAAPAPTSEAANDRNGPTEPRPATRSAAISDSCKGGTDASTAVATCSSWESKRRTSPSSDAMRATTASTAAIASTPARTTRVRRCRRHHARAVPAAPGDAGPVDAIGSGAASGVPPSRVSVGTRIPWEDSSIASAPPSRSKPPRTRADGIDPAPRRGLSLGDYCSRLPGRGGGASRSAEGRGSPEGTCHIDRPRPLLAPRRATYDLAAAHGSSVELTEASPWWS